MKLLLAAKTLMMTTLLLAPATLKASGEVAKTYHDVEAAYDNAGAGVHLAGTLTIPDPRVPRSPPAIHHSRDAMACNVGVAVLRIDDRGVGQSTGN